MGEEVHPEASAICRKTTGRRMESKAETLFATYKKYAKRLRTTKSTSCSKFM
ncbi:hypothetical protein BDV98DRAFT_597405 [Pterulicium gracile]|uniref:Uncharacterized protein n=1 Tax=Pterulicium gracile TaxID=1884261 RepID=A0A5C3QDT0_9AGAR|nr:hypothetical protein BDV98DRAFT_597405 [Pterula gracilis]